jgi:hypothetical protein
MIRLTAKGLANYMTSGDARKRKILRDYKFPDPEGAVQAKYYAEARRIIEQYHRAGNDPSSLASDLVQLQAKANRASAKQLDRIKNNIRAVESYLRAFGRKKLSILPSPEIKMTRGQVVVSAHADLYIQDGDKHKILRLDMGKDTAKPQNIQIVLQVTINAVEESNLPVTPKDIIYVDVERGVEYSGRTVRKRLRKDIEAACQTIEDVWPKL